MRKLSKALRSFATSVLPVVLAFTTSSAYANGLFQTRLQFSIESAPLHVALNRWAEQSGQFVLTPIVGSEMQTKPIQGKYTPEAALRELLEGSDLWYCYVKEKTVAVMSADRIDASSPICNPRIEEVLKREVLRGNDRTDQRDRIPEVLIKGSRPTNSDIRRTQDDIQPYVILDPEEIARSGAATIGDLLTNRLTMGSGISNSPQEHGFRGSACNINLRGLPSNQTLILIDGRPVPPFTISGSVQQPDICSIPLSFVERVEVLPATAAGIYGGNATGGAINIVFKSDYTGFEAASRYENTFGGGGTNKTVGLHWRDLFNAGRTSLTFAGVYADSDPLLAEDRPYLHERARDYHLQSNSLPGKPFIPPLGFTTNITSIDGSNLTLKDGTPLSSPFTSVPIGYAGSAADGGAALVANAGRYNLEFANTAQPGGLQESLLNAPTTLMWRAGLEHQFNNKLAMFLDVIGTENRGRFFTNKLNTTFDMPAGAPGNPFAQNIRLTTPGIGANRNIAVDIRSDRASLGVTYKSGDLWQTSFEATMGRASYGSSAGGSFSNSARDDLLSGKINVFKDTNLHTNDYAALAGADVRFTEAITKLMDFRLSAIAHPSYKGRYLFDVYGYIGFKQENFGGQSLESDAYHFYAPPQRQKDISSFLQLSKKLVDADDGLVGMRSLEVSAWFRHDDYTSRGSDFVANQVRESKNRTSAFSPAFGFSYAPGVNLMFRSSYTWGSLVPTLDQIAPSGFIDLPYGALGFTDRARGNEPIGAVRVFSGGNPDLQPEKSRSLSAGAVIKIPSVHLRLSVDWSHIEKSNEIFGMVLSQPVLDNSAALSDGFVIRGAKLPGDPYDLGPIIGLSSRPQNVEDRDIESLDFLMEAGPIYLLTGHAHLSFAGTRELGSATRISASAPWIEYSGLVSLPSWKAVADFTWSKGGFDLTWTTRAIDGYWLNAEHTPDPVLQRATVPTQIYHNLSMRYALPDLPFGGDTEIQVGVTNVFNTTPPLDPTALVSGYSRHSPHGSPKGAGWYFGFTTQF